MKERKTISIQKWAKKARNNRIKKSGFKKRAGKRGILMAHQNYNDKEEVIISNLLREKLGDLKEEKIKNYFYIWKKNNQK